MHLYFAPQLPCSHLHRVTRPWHEVKADRRVEMEEKFEVPKDLDLGESNEKQRASLKKYAI